jgi:hypothetical protein
MRIVFSVSVFLGLMTAACGTTSESGTLGWGLKSVAHNSTTINVCWENRSQSDVLFKQFRFEFANHARSQFGRTNLSLVGWSDCGNQNGRNDIRITWWDKGEAELSNLGRSKLGKDISVYPNDLFTLPQIVFSEVKAAPTLALNGFTFSEFSRTSGLGTAKGVFKNTFLHELGHAVGMLHEHAHPGNNNFCTPNGESFKSHVQIWSRFDAESISKSAVGTRGFDARSIMNYCFLDAAEGNVVGLSDGDIATINAIYSPSLAQPVVRPPSVARPEVNPAVQQPVVDQPAPKSILQQPAIANPAPKFVMSAPMGACQSVFKVDDFLPQLVTLEGIPAFVCEDIMNLGYAPVLACTSSFDVKSCVPTKYEYIRGNFVLNRYL